MVNERTGSCFPKSDGKRECAVCSTYNSGLVAEAIDDSHPEVFLTLTGFAPEWKRSVHPIWRNMLKRAARAGHPSNSFDWLLVAEHNKSRRACHVHVLLRGDPPPEALWASAAEDLCGSVHLIEPVHSAIGSYLTKNCRPNLERECFECSRLELRQHVDLNDGRYVHQSRGFFLGDGGVPVGGLRAATDRIRAKHRQTNPADWAVVRVQ